MKQGASELTQMEPAEGRALLDRSGRKPLYVQVVTDPPLRECWSVNLSASGLGLIAQPVPGAAGPKEGDTLEVEFALPAGGGRIRAVGELRWRHDGAEGEAMSLGVSFTRFEDDAQVRLARYLLSYQLVVAIAFASPDDVAFLRQVLEPSATLLFVDGDGALDAALRRGDVSALVVAGAPERALAVVDRLVHTAEQAASVALRDLASRVILAAPLPADRVITLFNSGRLYRALPRPLEPDTVEHAVLAACREHGVRIEQERMAQELERTLQRERARSQAIVSAASTELPAMESRAMRRAMDLVRVAAPHKVAVLLQGETGTGKEVFARTVHQLSARARAPFVVQDCGALTETLLESELFGHVKGAFTGAVADHPGLFVLASGGTIFLDEIENTTANLQAKLLRVIETGEVRAVGGTQVRQVDVRVIAAANRTLEEEVKAARFRSDLFFRLNTFTVNLPPLRERGDDVLELARHFIGVFNQRLERRCTGMNAAVQELLRAYPWPGNVRELRNVIERAVLLCTGVEELTVAHLPETLTAFAGVSAPRRRDGSLRDRVDAYEREIIRAALERHGNVLRRAAAELATDAVTFGRKARRHGLWRGA